ncbi:MAG: hypothetical protein WCW64_05030 [Phycisphaerae bacterium]|jgi:hypothetical protein
MLCTIDCNAVSNVYSKIGWDGASAIGTWVFGIIFVVSVILVWWELVQVQRGIKSTSYHSTYSLMVDIDKFFIEKPKMIKYFREGVEYVHEEDITKEEVMMAAEMVTDYFDNVFHQKKTLPSKEAYYGFEKYMQDTYANSPALRNYIQEQERWYPPEFLQMLKK